MQKKRGRSTTPELAKLQTKAWMNHLTTALNAPNPSAAAAWLSPYLLPKRDGDLEVESLKRNFRNWSAGKVDISKSPFTLRAVSKAVAHELKSREVTLDLEETYRAGPDESCIFGAFNDPKHLITFHLAQTLGFEGEPLACARYVVEHPDPAPFQKLAASISSLSENEMESAYELFLEAFTTAARDGLCCGITPLDILHVLFDELRRQERTFESIYLLSLFESGAFDIPARYLPPFAVLIEYVKGHLFVSIIQGDALKSLLDAAPVPEKQTAKGNQKLFQFYSTELRKEAA